MKSIKNFFTIVFGCIAEARTKKAEYFTKTGK